MRDRAAEPTGENRYTDVCRDHVASEVTDSLQMVLSDCTTADLAQCPLRLPFNVVGPPQSRAQHDY